MKHYWLPKKIEMRQIIFKTIVFIQLLSCNSIKNSEADLNSQILIEKDTFYLIRHFPDGGKKQQGFDKITNNEDYLRWINNQNFGETIFEELLAIDFEKQDLLVYNLGERNEQDYRLQILQANFNKSKVSFEAKILLNQQLLTVNQKTYSPYQLIAIPKNKEVKFNFEQ
jgi:uncharacterized protein YrzB (UPF0473 family)